MNRLTPPLALLALSASALAQGFLTTPPGGLPHEGANYVSLFGWYPDVRYQQVDGNHVGNKAYTITDIGFRMDYQVHTQDTAMGRTWTRITLDVSETSNYQNLSRVWTQNITHSTSRVFDSTWSWPTIRGLPLLEPDVWGGSVGRLRFPFKQPWIYSGKREFLMDYTFRGGQLANAATWTGGQGAHYTLDGEQLSTGARLGPTLLLPRGQTRCADSAVTEPLASASTWAFAVVYTTQSAGNELLLAVMTQNTGNQRAIQAVGLGGSITGVDIGAKCNRLYVDFNKPFVLMASRTNQVPLIPWQAGYAGVNVWAQSVWTDSKTGQFSLTTASRATLPWGPPPGQLPRYKTIYNPDPDSPSSVAEPVTVGYYFPFTRYGIK